jgi:Uncharacterised nucleotidyltransferase
MIMQRLHAFDVVARILAEGVHRGEASDELRAAMRSTKVAWERVVGIASGHFVLPAMAAALKDLSLLKDLEDELAAFLEAVHAANLERNVELRAELAAAVKVLHRAGIEPVLLKGAIRLLDELYPDDGWRMLRDLDLLVPKAALADAVRAFEAAGYAPGEHGAFRRETGLCKIELHDELFAGSRQERLLRAANLRNGSRPWAFAGATVRIPSLEHQLVHLIGHGQLRHCGHAIGRVCLRDRLEAAALSHWGQEAVDWQVVARRFEAAGYRRPLLSFLLALRDGAWAAVPLAGRVDPLTALQRRRIALQTRSTAFDYVGSRAGWWVSEVKSQIQERDAGQPRGVRNLKRVVSERGAVRRMARAFWDRQRLLLRASPYLSLLVI